ncbi:hypothetical protein ECFDA505_4616, partial [Escherichia coli FDA505]
MARQVVA